ncbi:MAG: hypothetical protein LBL80_03610 [Ruminococcus sp.]|jgi:hypothetical protein|nr:hypothetical protein [Ruminococcus sp.]
MGMFEEMLGGSEGDDEVISTPSAPEIIARGEFVYSADDVLAGYTLFRKRYIKKQTILRLVIVGIALASSVFMLITDGFTTIPVICTALCVLCAAWFIKTPIDNKRKTARAVYEVGEERYGVEITPQTIKITLADEEVENEDDRPGTLIHLDQFVVDILDHDKIYVIVIGKQKVFVIPKNAFNDTENASIREKLKMAMEIRYKITEG